MSDKTEEVLELLMYIRRVLDEATELQTRLFKTYVVKYEEDGEERHKYPGWWWDYHDLKGSIRVIANRVEECFKPEIDSARKAAVADQIPINTLIRSVDEDYTFGSCEAYLATFTKPRSNKCL